MMNQMDSDETENLAVQSEFGYNHFGLDNRLEELRVSDHPHLDPDQPVYENTVEQIQPKIRVRRSSAGDEATLICDFGDFKTQELLTRPSDFSPATSLSSFQRGAAGRQQSHHDVLNYSTNSESYHGSSNVSYPRSIPEHPGLQRLTSDQSPTASTSGGIYQNYIQHTNRVVPPVMPKPVRPFAPALFNMGPVDLVNHPYPSQSPVNKFSLKPSPPPRVPPKQTLPPPYRPPPGQSTVPNIPRSYHHPLHNNGNSSGIPHQPLQAFFMPPIEEDATGTSLLINPLSVQINRFDRHPILGLTTTTGTHSSSDGGSHDSHNDSGYCAVRIGGGSSAAGSGGPSPSLSGLLTFFPSFIQRATM